MKELGLDSVAADILGPGFDPTEGLLSRLGYGDVDIGASAGLGLGDSEVGTDDQREDADEGRPAPAAPAPARKPKQAAKEPGALPDPQVYGARIYDGLAFDTCHAPSLSTLRAWRDSPYGAVGIYYGGRARHCPSQPNLSRSWARGAETLGFRLLPIYVGSQAPCVRNEKKRAFAIGGEPWDQGRREGAEAVARAKTLGMAKRSALYLDMEAYDRKNTRCAATTLLFIRGWVREVRSRGYFPGFYSSADAGIQHLETARRSGVRDLPSVVWFARWHTAAALYEEPVLRPKAWHPHRRIHQYAGDVSESHGGKRLRIDRNRVDAPVAIVR
ncbi:DUF1906 domain-containing protein [Streptomyces palmae]|uniref:DUF1906 domain-containing protein n=2 Tax=Streptomyces palmae TaxID=1701085 RepID=A0A4Z0GJ21_9ACTN|nr:DUF1906 domain-containing protein [Streptomyces palmae]